MINGVSGNHLSSLKMKYQEAKKKGDTVAMNRAQSEATQLMNQTSKQLHPRDTVEISENAAAQYQQSLVGK